jgi:hypothetical protein
MDGVVELESDIVVCSGDGVTMILSVGEDDYGLRDGGRSGVLRSDEEDWGSDAEVGGVDSIDGCLRVFNYYGLQSKSFGAAWIDESNIRKVGGLDPSEDVRCGPCPLRFGNRFVVSMNY